MFINAKTYKKNIEEKHPSQTSKMAILAKIAQDIQFLTIFQKSPSQKSGGVHSACYEIAVRKFPMYKLKQKNVKNVKNYLYNTP